MGAKEMLPPCFLPFHIGAGFSSDSCPFGENGVTLISTIKV